MSFDKLASDLLEGKDFSTVPVPYEDPFSDVLAKLSPFIDRLENELDLIVEQEMESELQGRKYLWLNIWRWISSGYPQDVAVVKISASGSLTYEIILSRNRGRRGGRSHIDQLDRLFNRIKYAVQGVDEAKDFSTNPEPWKSPRDERLALARKLAKDLKRAGLDVTLGVYRGTDGAVVYAAKNGEQFARFNISFKDEPYLHLTLRAKKSLASDLYISDRVDSIEDAYSKILDAASLIL